jgi:signal transduction histidine kinase
VEGDHIVAVVSDDGSGFSVMPTTDGSTGQRAAGSSDNGALPPGLSGGVGLSAMRERADLVGAELEVRSRPAEGTTVRVSVPVSARESPEI